jgi:hypothetical protein
MLFLIFVAILIAGIIWVSCDAKYWRYEEGKWGSIVLGALAVAISIFIMCTNYIGADAYVDRMNTRYDTLIYQYENNIYDNDNDLGKRELMVDIQSWNEDLAFKQKLQDDFWVGIYIPDIYDQFKPIELKK